MLSAVGEKLPPLSHFGSLDSRIGTSLTLFLLRSQNLAPLSHTFPLRNQNLAPLHTFGWGMAAVGWGMAAVGWGMAAVGWGMAAVG